MRHKNKIKGFILLLFLFSFSAFAADEVDEAQTSDDTAETVNKATSKPLQERSFTPSQVKRIEALTRQIEINAADEIEKLSFQGDTFLALHKAAQTNDPQGCIILLHGNNEHPDWPNVINPVRSELIKSSWCTISIEVPDSLKKEALSFTPQEEGESEQTEDNALLTHEEVVFGRIDASIAFANEKGISNISLLGYGTSATYALKYSASKQLNTGALILISASVPNQLDFSPFAELLKESAQPVLDYYIRPNQFDIHYAQARRTAMLQRENQTPNYTQIKVTSNSQFSIDQKQLVQRIRGFLKQNTQQREQLKTLPEFKKSLFYQSP